MRLLPLLIAAIFLLYGCQLDKSDSQDDQLEDRRVATEMINNLDAALIAGGLEEGQASVICEGAESQVKTMNLENSNRIESVAPQVVKGAEAAINSPAALLTTDSEKLEVLGIILTSVTESLKIGTALSSSNTLKQDSFTQVQPAQDYNLSQTSLYSEAVQNIANIATTGISEMGLATTDPETATTVIVENISQSFAIAGINDGELPEVAGNLMTGLLSALPSVDGFADASSDIVKQANKALYIGLGTAGYEDETLQSTIDMVGEGSVYGLKAANYNDQQIACFLSPICGGVIEGLSATVSDSSVIPTIEVSLNQALDQGLLKVTPPEVSSLSPDSSTDIPINTAIAITFNKGIDTSTITVNSDSQTCSGSIQLADVSDDSGCILLNRNMTFSNNNKTVTLVPQSDLSYETMYRLKITDNVKSQWGINLAGEFVRNPFFKAISPPDTDPPGITQTTPANNDVEVSIATDLVLEFDEPVEMSTITGAVDGNCTGSVQLSKDSFVNCVAFSQTVAENVQGSTIVKFQLNGTLDHDGNYQLKMTQDIKDVAGNPLDSDYFIDFTTTTDNSPPLISKVVPGDSSVDILPETTITVTFDEAMDPSTITSTDTSVCQGAVQVSLDEFVTCVPMVDTTASAWNNDLSFTFTPESSLESASTCKVRVSTAARDSKGNALAAAYTSTSGFVTLAKTTQISAGDQHVCATFPDNTAKCWGSPYFGRLGQANTNRYGTDTALMSSLPTISFDTGEFPINTIAGNAHTCAYLNNGKIKCWGKASSGALGVNIANYGDGSTETISALAPLALKSGNAVQLALSNQNACALSDEGSIFCWGDGGEELGHDNLYGFMDVPYNGSPLFSDIEPINFENNKSAKSITMGSGHSCAVMSNNQIKCWGYNNNGQLGNNDNREWGRGGLSVHYDWYMNELPDVNLGTDYSVKQVSAKGGFTCAILNQLKDSNNVVCWGYNNYGQLGQGDTLTRGDSLADNKRTDLIPAVKLNRPAIQISAGTNHVCAILDNNCLKCWGYGSYGRLGYGDTQSRGVLPGEIEALSCVNLGDGLHAVSVEAGTYYTCAVLNDGNIKCWGNNSSGQLGQNNTKEVYDPSTIPPIAFE